MKARFPWLWDTELGNEDFEVLLRGEGVSAGHDVRWALLRLIEYAPYSDLRRLLPRERFLRNGVPLPLVPGTPPSRCVAIGTSFIGSKTGH
jgi:hypothetical protein